MDGGMDGGIDGREDGWTGSTYPCILDVLAPPSPPLTAAEPTDSRERAATPCRLNSRRPVRHYPTPPSSSSSLPIFFMSVVFVIFRLAGGGGEIIRCGAGGVVYRWVGVRSYLDNMIFLAALSPVLWCGGLLACGFRGGGASVLFCFGCGPVLVG